MSTMKMLDVAIGLTFLYLMLSMLGSGIIELIAWAQGLRATTLQDSIKRLLSDPGLSSLAKKVYEHPLVKGLESTTLDLGGVVRFWKKPRSSEQKLPSYIPSDIFANALMAVISAPAAELKLADLRRGIDNAPAGDVKTALNALLDEGVKDIEQGRKAIGRWFDTAMDRLSGEYKRYSKKLLMVLAMMMAVALNVDSWRVASALWTDPKLSEAVANAAIEASKNESAPGAPAHPSDPDETIRRLVATNQRIGALNLPIGWGAEGPARPFKNGAGQWFWFALVKLLGWLFTAAAVSLGAQFWFEALNRLVNLRTSGKPPESNAKTV